MKPAPVVALQACPRRSESKPADGTTAMLAPFRETDGTIRTRRLSPRPRFVQWFSAALAAGRTIHINANPPFSFAPGPQLGYDMATRGRFDARHASKFERPRANWSTATAIAASLSDGAAPRVCAPRGADAATDAVDLGYTGHNRPGPWVSLESANTET